MSCPPTLRDHRRSRRRRCRRPQSALILPAVLLDHVSQLDDKLSLLVLLAGLVGLLVLPTQRRFAAITVNVSHGVEAWKSKSWMRSHFWPVEVNDIIGAE